GREWRGTTAIRRWRATVATAYQYTVQVTGAEALDEADGAERHDVHVHLEGNFPGGQVDLTDRFALRGGRIASLEIVPAGPGSAAGTDRGLAQPCVRRRHPDSPRDPGRVARVSRGVAGVRPRAGQ